MAQSRQSAAVLYKKLIPPRSAENRVCSQQVIYKYSWSESRFRCLQVSFGTFCWSVMITSIRGSIHQGHEAFREHSRGRQCVFMSLAALFFNRWNSADLWTQTNIDNILCHGDCMYLHALTNKTVLDANSLSIEELPEVAIVRRNCCVVIHMPEHSPFSIFLFKVTNDYSEVLSTEWTKQETAVKLPAVTHSKQLSRNWTEKSVCTVPDLISLISFIVLPFVQLWASSNIILSSILLASSTSIPEKKKELPFFSDLHKI